LSLNSRSIREACVPLPLPGGPKIIPIIRPRSRFRTFGANRSLTISDYALLAPTVRLRATGR
jgi:hypothetical protein